MLLTPWKQRSQIQTSLVQWRTLRLMDAQTAESIGESFRYYFYVLLKVLSLYKGVFLVFCTLNRRSIFPSKISPSLNIPDLHPKVAYCFSEGSTVSEKNTSDKWQTDVGPSWHGNFDRDAFRFWTTWQCRTLSALSNSRKDDYVSRMGKKQPGKAVLSHPKRRRKQEKHQWQVNISSFDPECFDFQEFQWNHHALPSITTRAQQNSVFDLDALFPLTGVFHCSYIMHV